MAVTRMLFLGFRGLNKNEVFECIFAESVELFFDIRIVHFLLAVLLCLHILFLPKIAELKYSKAHLVNDNHSESHINGNVNIARS